MGHDLITRKYNSDVGMACPVCTGEDIRVTDSRPSVFGSIGSTRRRRKCSDCGEAWTTFEIPEHAITSIRKTAITDVMRAALQELDNL